MVALRTCKPPFLLPKLRTLTCTQIARPFVQRIRNRKPYGLFTWQRSVSLSVLGANRAPLTQCSLVEEENDGDSERLNKLAAFQLKMIRHAMTCAFLDQRPATRQSECPATVVPSVQRIVYSTCSVHATENEHVVQQALKTEEAINGKFKLALKQDVLPTWRRRGIPDEMDNAGVLNVI